MKTIADIKEINTFVINVEERIEKRFLKNFIKNSILLNNFEFKKNDKIFLLYIEEISSYEVIILNSNYRYFIVEVFFSIYKEGNNVDNVDLYLCDEFFCLFKNSNLYYFQKIDLNVDINELIEYVNKKLNIQINNYKKINNDELNLIKKDFLALDADNILENINKNFNYSIWIYFSYLLLIVTFSFFYFIDNQSTKIKEKEPINYEKIKNKHLYSYFDDDFSVLYKRIKENKLQLKELYYKNKNWKIVLLSKNKDDIYSFLISYKSSLIENTIIYLPLEKLYECTLNVK